MGCGGAWGCVGVWGVRGGCVGGLCVLVQTFLLRAEVPTEDIMLFLYIVGGLGTWGLETQVRSCF